MKQLRSEFAEARTFLFTDESRAALDAINALAQRCAQGLHPDLKFSGDQAPPST
jgi:hypothetical protein